MIANDVIVFVSQQGVPYGTPLMIYASRQQSKQANLNIVVEKENVICQVVQEGNSIIIKGQQSFYWMQQHYNVFQSQQNIKLDKICKTSKKLQSNINILKYIDSQFIKSFIPDAQISNTADLKNKIGRKQQLSKLRCSFFPQSALQQILDISRQQQSNILNCSIGKTFFRIYLYNAADAKKFVFSDIDGTLTIHDIYFSCNRCIKLKLINQILDFLSTKTLSVSNKSTSKKVLSQNAIKSYYVTFSEAESYTKKGETNYYVKQSKNDSLSTYTDPQDISNNKQHVTQSDENITMNPLFFRKTGEQPNSVQSSQKADIAFNDSCKSNRYTNVAWQLPIVLVSARNGHKMFRYLSDKTAKACFGQLLPQINMIRHSAFHFPSHQMRSAFKAAAIGHVQNALISAINGKQAQNSIENSKFNFQAIQSQLELAGVHTMAFGNSASDALGFRAGGCSDVVIPRDLLLYSNLLGDVEDVIVKSKQLRRRSEVELQDWVIKNALHTITVLDAGDLGLEDAETLIRQCKMLQFLSLRGNRLTTATKIAGNFKNLLVLDISNNNLTNLGYRVYWSGLSSLRVLLLANNQIEKEISALDMLEPLQNLLRLDLYNNPIEKSNSDEIYIKSILQVLPRVQVIDGSFVSCILHTKYANSYLNNPYFTQRRKGNKYKWFAKVGEEMILQFSDSNSKQFENLAQAKLNGLMHDGKFSGKYSLHILMLSNSELLERQKIVCPILTLQSHLKMARVKKNISTWTQNYQKYITLIQKRFKGASVRIRHQLQIKLFIILAKTNRRIKRTYFYTVLVVSSKLRDYKVKLKIINAVIRIQNYIRMNFSARACPDDIILAQKPSVDEKHYTFMMARTYSTPQDCIAFVVLLARSIISQIDQTQQQYMEEFNSSMITYSHSQFQFISARKNVIRRSFKYKADEILKQIPLLCLKQKVKYYQMNRQLTYDHRNYKKSDDFIIKSKIKQPTKSVINTFVQNSNGNMPMCLYITVKHKELAAIFNYLTNTTVFPIYNLEGEQINQTQRIDIAGKSLIHLKLNQYSLGQAIMNNYVSRQFQATIYDMMISSIIPSQFLVGNYRAQTYMFGLDNITEISAALHIQKVYRALKHNKQQIMLQRDMLNFQFFSMYQVFTTIAAIKLIQKQMRARLACKQINIVRRMAIIYKSVMRNDCILIPKDNFDKLLENNYERQGTMIKHLVNLSPVISTNHWSNFFHTLNDQIKVQLDQLQRTLYANVDYSVNRDTQVASIPLNKPELYKTMENNIMCKEDYINEGFVSVQSQKLDFAFLYSKNTLQKYINQVGFIEYQGAKEILAVKLRSQYISEAKDRVLDPVSMMSLQTKAGENMTGNILLNSFKVAMVHGIQSNKAFNLNFLQNTELVQSNKDFLEQFLPKNGVLRHQYEPKAYIPQYLWPYVKVAAQNCYIMQHKRKDVQQLALKCYILENRYFNPKIIDSDNLYNQQTLLTFEDFIKTAATICIQTQLRTFQVRRRIKSFKVSIAKRLKEVAISSADGITAAAIDQLSRADAEKQFISQMRLRRSAIEHSKIKQQNHFFEKQRAQSAGTQQYGLLVKPVHFYDRFRRNIKLENMISRCDAQYQRSIRSASSFCMKAKILEHNQMLCQVIKNYTRHKNYPKQHTQEIIGNLSALQQTGQYKQEISGCSLPASALQSKILGPRISEFSTSSGNVNEAAPVVDLGEDNDSIQNNIDNFVQIDNDNEQHNIWDEDIEIFKQRTQKQKLYTSRRVSTQQVTKLNSSKMQSSARSDKISSANSQQFRIPSSNAKRPNFIPALGDVYSTAILFDDLNAVPKELFKISPIKNNGALKQQLHSRDVQLYANKISQLNNKQSRVQSQQTYSQISQIKAKFSDKKNNEINFQLQKQRDAEFQRKKEIMEKQKIMLKVTRNTKIANQITVSTLKDILRDQ